MKNNKYLSEVTTPAFIFDTDELKTRAAFIKKALPENAFLCYAMKANPFLIRPLTGIVDSFEVCSSGEARICERAGIAHSQIVLSGVNKKESDIFYQVAIFKDKALYTAESLEHVRILDAAARRIEIKIKVVLRLTSSNQFGMDAAVVEEIIKERSNYYFNIKGLHYYSGTQKKLSQVKKELDMLDALYSAYQEKYNFKAELLEYGPGFSVNYFRSDQPSDEEELLKEFAQMLTSMKFKGHFNIELGRFIAAYCGKYVTEIADIKTNNGHNYMIVDGGINHLNYYGQTMSMRHPFVLQIKDKKNLKESKWTVCGSLCTVADVIVRDLPLYEPEIGERLVFERTGAYTVTEGIYLFLSRDLPTVYFYSEKEGLYIARGAVMTDTINSARSSGPQSPSAGEQTYFRPTP